jgi:hypothetical protein
VAVWLCGCVAVWLCGCVAVWLCGFVAVWLCGCVAVGLWLHLWLHLWLYLWLYLWLGFEPGLDSGSGSGHGSRQQAAGTWMASKAASAASMPDFIAVWVPLIFGTLRNPAAHPTCQKWKSAGSRDAPHLARMGAKTGSRRNTSRLPR